MRLQRITVAHRGGLEVERYLPRHAQSLQALTAREKAVLHLICAGHSNREIASLLSLAEGTVKNHVSNLLLKLNARGRTRAALIAIKEGHIG